MQPKPGHQPDGAEQPVAVVGCGPAAGAAALALARGGREVTLYRPARPGEKPCGGAVPDFLLDELPGFDASGLDHVADPEAVVENAAGGRLELELRGIRIFRRADLDPALVAAAAAAGARVEPRKVSRLEAAADGVTVVAGDSRRRFGWAIAAGGARDPLRRGLGLPPHEESIGLGATLRGIEWRRLVLAFPDVADSYLWIFPRPGGASVGIAYSAQRLSAGAAAGLLDRFLRRHLPRRMRQAEGPRYRYPIPVFSPATAPALRRAAARRVLLAGDAAALADPLTREGIRYAVRSGLRAAAGLLSGRPEEYPERLVAEVAAELARAARLRELFFDDRLAQWMIPLSRAHPGVRRLLSNLLACRQPYRGLRRRLLATALWPRSLPPFSGGSGGQPAAA